MEDLGEAISTEPTDQPAPDAAAFAGKIDLYDGGGGRSGIDALVPNAVFYDMWRAGEALDLTWLHICSFDDRTAIEV